MNFTVQQHLRLNENDLTVNPNTLAFLEKKLQDGKKLTPTKSTKYKTDEQLSAVA